MGQLLEKYKKQFSDIQREYLDKSGLGLILELLLSADSVNLAELDKVKKDLSDNYQLKNKSLNIFDSNGNNKLFSYDGNIEKKLLFKFNKGVNDLKEDVIWLQVGERSFNEETGKEEDHFENMTFFRTDLFTRDFFLKDVKTKVVTEDNKEDDEVVGKTYLIFVIQDKSGKNKDTVLKLDVSEFFSGEASQIILKEIKIGDNIIIPDETNVQEALAIIAQEIIDNRETINEIIAELDRFVPITPQEIYEMMGMNSDQANQMILSGIENGRDTTLYDNLHVDGKSLDLGKNSQKINLGGKVLSSDGSRDGYNHTIILNNFGGEENTIIALTDGTIKGLPANDINITGATATILVRDNINLYLENVEVEGMVPVYVLADTNTNIIIESGKFVGYGPQVVYVQRNAGKVIIEDGYFESNNTDPTSLDENGNQRFLINLKDEIRADKAPIEFIEVHGGEFVNFNPANNASEGPRTNYVPEGYTVEEREEDGKRIYKVVKL